MSRFFKQLRSAGSLPTADLRMTQSNKDYETIELEKIIHEFGTPCFSSLTFQQILGGREPLFTCFDANNDAINAAFSSSVDVPFHKNPRLLYLDLEINKRTTYAMIDFGSTENLMTLKLGQKLGVKILKLDRPLVTHLANGSDHNFNLVAKATLKYKNHEIDQVFWILERDVKESTCIIVGEPVISEMMIVPLMYRKEVFSLRDSVDQQNLLKELSSDINKIKKSKLQITKEEQERNKSIVASQFCAFDFNDPFVDRVICGLMKVWRKDKHWSYFYPRPTQNILDGHKDLKTKSLTFFRNYDPTEFKKTDWRNPAIRKFDPKSHPNITWRDEKGGKSIQDIIPNDLTRSEDNNVSIDKPKGLFKNTWYREEEMKELEEAGALDDLEMYCGAYRTKVNKGLCQIQDPDAWNGLEQIKEGRTQIECLCPYDETLCHKDHEKDFWRVLRKDVKSVNSLRREVNCCDILEHKSDHEPIIASDVPRNKDGLKYKIFLDDIKDPEERKQMADLLRKYEDCFEEDYVNLTKSVWPPLEVKIDDGLKPGKAKYIRHSPKEKRILLERMEDEVKAGVFKDSTSPYSCNGFLVTKGIPEHCKDVPENTKEYEDMRYRFVIGYHHLVNKHVIDDCKSLPHTNEFITALPKARRLSVLDVKSGYHQFRINEECQEKLAFNAAGRLLQPLVIPMGLKISPMLYQRTMETIFKEPLKKFCFIYIDDALVYSETWEDHLFHVEEMLKIYRKWRIKLNPKKCRFGAEEVKYLGQMVSCKGVRPDPKKLTAILDMPRPKNLTELQKFLGLINYQAKFIPNSTILTQPLYTLAAKTLVKSAKLNWNQDHEESFVKLKKIMSESPFLVAFDPELETVITCDASGTGIAGILKQIHVDKMTGEKDERIVEYFSRKLGPSEQNYIIFEKELLACVESILQWHYYLFMDKEFTVETDCQAITYWNEIGRKDPSKPINARRVSIWKCSVEPFKFKMVGIRGKNNAAADCLSRLTQENKVDTIEELPESLRLIASSWSNLSEGMNAVKLLSDIPREAQRIISSTELVRCLAENSSNDDCSIDIPESWDINAFVSSHPHDELILQQHLDPFIRNIVNELQNPSDQHHTEILMKNYILSENGLLYRQIPHHDKINRHDGKKSRCVMVLPETMVMKVLHEAHDDKITGGHLGHFKVLQKIKERFWFPDMNRKIFRYVTSCPDCIRNKSKMFKEGSTQPIIFEYEGKVLHPFDVIAVDAMVFTGPNKSGRYQYVMMAVDLLTGFTIAAPLSSLKYDSIMKFFVEHVFPFGIPLTVISDNATSFKNIKWNDFCDNMSIRRRYITPYHPSSNGLAERAVGTFKLMARAWCAANPKSWPKIIPAVAYAYNTAVKREANYSPYFLLFGHHGRLDSIGDYEVPEGHDDLLQLNPAEPNETIEKFIIRIKKCREEAMAKLMEKGKKWKTKADKFRRVASYEEGQRVVKKNVILETGTPHAFHRPFSKEFIVTRQCTPNVVELIDPDGEGKHRCHVDMLKKARSRDSELIRLQRLGEDYAAGRIPDDPYDPSYERIYEERYPREPVRNRQETEVTVEETDEDFTIEDADDEEADKFHKNSIQTESNMVPKEYDFDRPKCNSEKDAEANFIPVAPRRSNRQKTMHFYRQNRPYRRRQNDEEEFRRSESGRSSSSFSNDSERILK